MLGRGFLENSWQNPGSSHGANILELYLVGFCAGEDDRQDILSGGNHKNKLEKCRVRFSCPLELRVHMGTQARCQ
jgi:hypothetical protein